MDASPRERRSLVERRVIRMWLLKETRAPACSMERADYYTSLHAEAKTFEALLAANERG